MTDSCGGYCRIDDERQQKRDLYVRVRSAALRLLRAHALLTAAQGPPVEKFFEYYSKQVATPLYE